MRELIKATKTTKRAIRAGRDTVAFAKKMKQADNKTRFMTTGKLLGLVTLGLSKLFVREMWRQSKNMDLSFNGDVPLMNVPTNERNDVGQIETKIKTFKSKN